jgi:RHS repeat-associated protein
MKTTATGSAVAQSKRGDSAVATATPIVRYVHTDNLGSTAVTSDTNGGFAQSLDYAPFGSLLASSNTGTTTVARQFIGQYSDPSGLDYLNSRFYNPGQGQFLTEDPVFVDGPRQETLQDPQSLNTSQTAGSASNLVSGSSLSGNIQPGSNSKSIWARDLRDPQQQNAYGYSRDNPINYSDPTGLFGIFANWSAGGAAGLGEGFAGSVEGGAGFTAGNSPSDPIDYGDYGTSGYLAGGPYGSATVRGISGMNNSTALGLSGGAGLGLMVTNATRLSQLNGVTQSNSLSLGILNVNWAVAPNGIWTISANVGPRPFLSFSTYPTATMTTTLYSAAGSGGSTPGSSAGNTHTACGTLCR